jgi:hypothetical protein
VGDTDGDPRLSPMAIPPTAMHARDRPVESRRATQRIALSRGEPR